MCSGSVWRPIRGHLRGFQVQVPLAQIRTFWRALPQTRLHFLQHTAGTAVDFAAELAPSLQQSRQLSVKTLGDGKVYAVPTTLTAKVYIADGYMYSEVGSRGVVPGRGKGGKGEAAEEDRKQQATLLRGKVREGERVVRDLLLSHVRCRPAASVNNVSVYNVIFGN